MLSQVFPSSLNLKKTSWVELFVFVLTTCATLKLSKQMCIPYTTVIIRLVKAASNLLHEANASASYIFALSPNENSFVPNHWFFYLKTHLAPSPIGMPVWSTSCNPSMYTIMSLLLLACKYEIKSLFILSFLPVPPVARKTLSAPLN